MQEIPPFDLTNYRIDYGVHNDKNVIFFDFPYNLSLVKSLKSKLKVYWSRSHSKWYCFDMDQYRSLLGIPLKPIGEEITHRIHPTNLPAYRWMQQELVLVGYSVHTQRTYLQEFGKFLLTIKHHPVEEFTTERLRVYMFYCAEKLKLKESTLHSRLNAIKFYYDHMRGQKELFYEVPRPKKQSSLPKVLSKSELKKMFDLTTNINHKVILQLVYGMGLRVSEIVSLKITDIDSKRMMVHLRCAKGKKDRYVPLPKSILDLTREYFRIYRPKDYLFEGMTGGPYTVRSVQAVFKSAMNRARIKKPIGIHGLRHSYATHLLEAGTDMTFIQKLLGHRDIKTTMIYAKVGDRTIANIESPLDRLNISD